MSPPLQHHVAPRDYLAIVAAIVPPTAPLAVLGLGAGTVAHIIHRLFPEASMVGWELDLGVVMTAQMFLGLSTLEASGKLVRIVVSTLS